MKINFILKVAKNECDYQILNFNYLHIVESEREEKVSIGNYVINGPENEQNFFFF